MVETSPYQVLFRNEMRLYENFDYGEKRRRVSRLSGNDELKRERLDVLPEVPSI
jgi:hypothetical protein